MACAAVSPPESPRTLHTRRPLHRMARRSRITVVTGAADMTARVWDVETGKELLQLEHDTPIRAVALAQSELRPVVACATDDVMGQPARITVWALTPGAAARDALAQEEPVARWQFESKVIKMAFVNCDRELLSVHDNGTIAKWNAETGAKLASAQIHSKRIMDMQFDPRRQTVLTASKDGKSLLIDVVTLKVLNEFQSETQINSAAQLPLRDLIVLGGGQEALIVTQTATSAAHFEAMFFHKVVRGRFCRAPLV